MKILLAAAVVLAPAVAAAQQAPSLNLACKGTIAVADYASTQRVLPSPYGVIAPVMPLPAADAFRAETMSIVIDGAAGRVKPSFSAVIGQKSADGWYPIQDLVVSEATITGEVRTGYLLKSKLRIDRKTGAVTYSEFRGVCEKATTAPDENKF